MTRQRRIPKELVYGDLHLVMGVRDTVVELHINENGSGTLKVERAGKDITNVAWEAEKSVIANLDQMSIGERETI